MTLLGWMHRKLMQNSAEPTKNPMTRNPSTCFSVQTLSDNEQSYHIEPTKRLSHSNNKCTQKSSDIFEASPVVVLCQEEPFEPFDFLSIGTLGTMELLNTDPPTPTLPNLTDQQIEITENELNLISYELEKFLDAEDHMDVGNDTSERSSHASIITLSYKANEGADSEGHVHMVACPLKSYLFAASVELADQIDHKDAKKERTSLGELFKSNNLVKDHHPVKKLCEGAEQEVKAKNVTHFMKKMAKKFHSSSSGSPPNDSNPIKKKLYKNLAKMFQRKVYPEEMADKEFIKLAKGKKKGSGDNSFDQSTSKKSKKNTMKLSWAGICKGASPVKGGHWIKTDSDYLVLEL